MRRRGKGEKRSERSGRSAESKRKRQFALADGRLAQDVGQIQGEKAALRLPALHKRGIPREGIHAAGKICGVGRGKEIGELLGRVVPGDGGERLTETAGAEKIRGIGGKIQQIGSPQDIYNEPRNAFVAKFIGDSNIVDGIMEKDFLVSFGGQEFACVDRGFKPREPVQVVIRPEDVDIVPPSAGKLTGLVREVIFKGVHFEMHVDVEGKEWLIHSTQASQPGELIGMNIGPDEIHIMSREEV